MGDEIIVTRWNSSTGFLIVLLGSIIWLSGICKFYFLMYVDAGGRCLIRYINDVVIMDIIIKFKYRGLIYNNPHSMQTIE